MAKPFLKWVGGKSSIAHHIVAAIESSGVDLSVPGATYREPFLGSGAVFFALRERLRGPLRSALTDANKELVNVFREVRDAHVVVTEEAARWPLDRGTFDYLKREFRGFDAHKTWTAARTIYLNRTCFNGLYRLGPNGFNVPWGGPFQDPGLVQVALARLEDCALALAGSEVSACDFGAAVAAAGPGDLVYCDPPYPGGFSGYVGDFSFADHERLRDAVFAAAGRGARCVVSISDTPWSRHAYGDGFLYLLDVPRTVSARAEGRMPAPEILAVVGDGVKAGRSSSPPTSRRASTDKTEPDHEPHEVRGSLGLHPEVKVAWIDGLDSWAIYPGRFSPVAEVLFVSERQLASEALIAKIRTDVLRNRLL